MMMDKLKEIIQKNNDNTVFKALGLYIEKLDSDETIVSLAVDQRHYQHVGLVHGGVFVLMAESAASLAAACTLTMPSSSVVALEINANHLRPVKQGKLSAHSQCLHHGRRTLVYQVRVVDDKKNLVSMARCTLMVVESL